MDADEKLTAFVELESAIKSIALLMFVFRLERRLDLRFRRYFNNHDARFVASRILKLNV